MSNLYFVMGNENQQLEQLILILQYFSIHMNLNWSRLYQKQQYQGQEKQGFTLTYIPHLQSLLLFGGSHIKTNQVHLFNLCTPTITTRKINMGDSENLIPQKNHIINVHCSDIEESIRALIVFGGEAEKGRSLDTLDALFLDDWKWRKLALKNSPPPRQYHTMTKLESGNYLIFGGITLPYGTFLNDLWVIRGINQIRDISTLEVPGCLASEIATKGHKPSGRHSHAGYSFGENYYIIGGEGESYEQHFTIYSLNTKKLSWTKHNFNMTVPQLRSFSQIINPETKGNQLLIFGGVQINQKKPNRQIYSLQFMKDHPPRLRHLSRVSNEIPNEMLENSCSLPFEELCGVSCTFVQGSRMIVSKIQILENPSELSIEQYLKQIKSSQILSQQLLKKSQNLQLLYRQIQNYISILYNQYQDYIEQEHYNDDPYFDEEEFELEQREIEKEKKLQIEQCLKLKNLYMKIDKTYQENLMMLKNARNELAILNENFEGCMETQRDEQL